MTAQANDQLNNELSHATVGMVLAGALTKVDEASPSCAWTGFQVTMAVVVLIKGQYLARIEHLEPLAGYGVACAGISDRHLGCRSLSAKPAGYTEKRGTGIPAALLIAGCLTSLQRGWRRLLALAWPSR
jgi:hypothetical protein